MKLATRLQREKIGKRARCQNILTTLPLGGLVFNSRQQLSLDLPFVEAVLLADDDVHLRGFGLDVSNVDSAFGREEDGVGRPVGVDADVGLLGLLVGDEGLDDEGAELSGGLPDLKMKYYLNLHFTVHFRISPF